MKLAAIVDLLCCPDSGSSLSIKGNFLVCDDFPNRSYPFDNGVVDFLNDDSDYDEHWRTYAELPIPETKLQQAKQFVEWTIKNSKLKSKEKLVFLDIGCGDGCHIPFIPFDAIVIAVDYSASVQTVSERFGHLPNVIVVRADAKSLPFRSESVDAILSYSCFNHLDNPKEGIEEASRVLKIGGVASFWGFGTKSALLYFFVNFIRSFAKILRKIGLEKVLVNCLLPFMIFVPPRLESIGLKTPYKKVKKSFRPI